MSVYTKKQTELDNRQEDKVDGSPEDTYEEEVENKPDDRYQKGDGKNLNEHSYKSQRNKSKKKLETQLDSFVRESTSSQGLYTFNDEQKFEDAVKKITNEEISKSVQWSNQLEKRIQEISEERLDKELEQRSEELLRGSDSIREIIRDISNEESQKVVMNLVEFEENENIDELRLTKHSDHMKLGEDLHGEIEALHQIMISHLVWPASLLLSGITVGGTIISLASGSVIGLPLAGLSLLFTLTAVRIFTDDEINTQII